MPDQYGDIPSTRSFVLGVPQIMCGVSKYDQLWVTNNAIYISSETDKPVILLTQESS